MYQPLIWNIRIASHLQSTACEPMYLAASREAYLLQGIMRLDSGICVSIFSITSITQSEKLDVQSFIISSILKCQIGEYREDRRDGILKHFKETLLA